MHGFIFAVLVICVLEYTSGYCCFRNALMLSPRCGCSDYDYDTSCGIVKCPKASCGKAKYCNTCSNVCQCDCSPTYVVSSICDCGIPACSCCRDTSNVCFVYDKPSPVCSCLKTVSDRCGCDDMRSCIYFPEVEYPVTVIEMKPFYYGSCFTY